MIFKNCFESVVLKALTYSIATQEVIMALEMWIVNANVPDTREIMQPRLQQLGLFLIGGSKLSKNFCDFC